MAKYNVPFVNINTFIYEPTYVEKPSTFDIESFEAARILLEDSGIVLYPNHLNTEAYYSEKIRLLGGASSYTIRVQQNTLGILASSIANGGEINNYANTAFFEGQARLPTTASFFTALNLKRNGPYGYPTWRQIRAHENPLTRNQKKKNIITVVSDTRNISGYNQISINPLKYASTTPIEVFQESVFSHTKPLTIFFKKGPNVYKSTHNMSSVLEYFDNPRMNTLFAPFDLSDNFQTDRRFAIRFLDGLGARIGNYNNILSMEQETVIYPKKTAVTFEKRTRNNFYFPWKDIFEERFNKDVPNPIGSLTLVPTGRLAPNAQTSMKASLWPLDIHSDYATATNRNPGGAKYNLATNPGVLQHSMMYGRELQLGNINAAVLDSNNLQVHPLYSHKHTTTPLASVLGPHGMEIEGVNSGSTFGNLSGDHLLSGEAFWDAPSQYGKNPFYNDYTDFIYDIKKVSKKTSVLPEFRSSFNFSDLQNSPQRTPKAFLEITGGQAGIIIKNNERFIVSSSADKEFYDVYSHSDFIKNFDVLQEISSLSSKPIYKMSLKCKAVKKMVPYDGFYPAQRTVQIANKFMESLYPHGVYSGSHVGPVSASSEHAAPFFNNIMTPMFAPGIMYNSIKAGLATDYPIHTSSLNLANGGIKIYNSNHYIQKPFDERIPFEALLEPSDYLTGREIHCSNPHPSGNISGSALWAGTGDVSEYQMMMHNFLSETANFFLQDQNFSFIASKKSSDTNIDLISGSSYAFQVALYKSQNISSDKYTFSSVKYPSLIMTGSAVNETFTMYSRPSAFGPPSRVTSSNSGVGFTGSASDRGQNYPFTPPYYDGKAIAYYIFKATRTGRHTVQEVFNSSSVQQIRHTSEKVAGVIEEQLRYAHLNDIGVANSSFIKNSCMHVNNSINVNIGYVKDVDLLDDDTSEVVKVAVDISSDQDAQIIIQPKWETPMLNFQTYKNSSTVTLPLAGSQSVPRGMWHQYGLLEKDPNRGVFLKVSDMDPAYAGTTYLSIAEKLGFPTSPVKLGRTASKKVIREAVVAVPFYEYSTDARFAEEERKFFRLSGQEIQDALSGNGKESVIDMVEKMQRFVMPPMFNFLEDEEITPMPMYIFEFKHVLDQEDLAAIWQNLPPKIMTEFETKNVDSNAEEKIISHTFEQGELLSLASIENEGDVNTVLKKIRWMVFKVKQKASYNYYEKVVGEKKTLNMISPYSHNWPYDYFSLVELAKIDTSVAYADPPVLELPISLGGLPIIQPPTVNIPNIGPVAVPSSAPVQLTSFSRRETSVEETNSSVKLTNKKSLKVPSRSITPAQASKLTETTIPIATPAPGKTTKQKAKPVSNPTKTAAQTTIKVTNENNNLKLGVKKK